MPEPVLEGMDGSLQLPLPSMKRLNQIEPVVGLDVLYGFRFSLFSYI
jgi:hypothetical protein